MPSLALASVAIAVPIFAIVWWVSLRLHNYGFLDATWTLSIGLLAVMDGLAGDGLPNRRLLFTILGVIWSLRLGIFVLRRVMRHHPKEDKRYVSLRRRWKTPAAFLVFFELQALIAVVFSVPFLLAAVAPSLPMGMFEWTGLAIAALGIVGECIADAQAAAFKRRATSDILDAGLWRYSRHPNYFFESVVWVGFALACIRLPYGWLAVACPLLILYFLLRVTGIPLTEKHSLETHGEAYRDYQRRTSAFFLWPPKKRPGSGLTASA